MKANQFKQIIKDSVREVFQEELKKIQEWCEINQCGIRMSYDQFVFNSEQELSMFMLKWS